MDPAALADVARNLLRAAPGDFVAARTARQRAARKDDRELAAAIGKLKKPAPAAWIVDLLASEDALDDAVDLGPALRQAQASADPQQIATLRKQRSQVVAALADTGADRAAAAGHPPTPAVLEQVRATIEAGMADPHAGAAIRSGLLLRPLESVGFEDVDLTDALAVPDAVPDAWSGSDAPPIPITAGRRGARRPAGRGRADDERAVPDEPDAPDEPNAPAEPDAPGEPDGPAEPDAPAHDDDQRDPVAERRAAREAEAAARRASRQADAALDQAESALEDVEDRRADLDRRRRDLERQLAALDQERADLDAEAERLGQERDDAEAASDRAREALVAARRRRRDGS
ncbi:hypothetical protein [Curtobacterium sp. MCBD17_021]|uniref:hypothetical protein n=1 Tax=Curtobacterium sp. MCBD17_021 TaxID=2175665 RepID=UPI000DA8B38B|nr:hypothetical protein [Curtobacterium sp. MCBD17_021]PZE64798.1 hypothetical protein DEI83_11070 [Curtobacterium sp. MCBD17_021]